jgi:hypothetical protein
MQNNWFVLLLTILVVARPAEAEEITLYCAEQHIVGLQLKGSDWMPTYGDDDFGRRYAIRFNTSMSEMSGVHGTDTIYSCARYFPNKAPDMVTCINPLVATMVFNYSTDNKRFLFSFVGPGSWLAEGTAREEGRELLTDHLIMGECQAF